MVHFGLFCVRTRFSLASACVQGTAPHAFLLWSRSPTWPSFNFELEPRAARRLVRIHCKEILAWSLDSFTEPLASDQLTDRQIVSFTNRQMQRLASRQLVRVTGAAHLDMIHLARIHVRLYLRSDGGPVGAVRSTLRTRAF